MPQKLSAMSTLLGAYSDSGSSSDSEDIQQPGKQSEFKVPGSELMFAPLIDIEDEAKKTKTKDLDEELKKFMAELNR